VDMVLKLLRDWQWFLEFGKLLESQPDLANRTATVDGHDPSQVWTLKDHYAHCWAMAIRGHAWVRPYVDDEARNPPWSYAIPGAAELDLTKDFHELLGLVDAETHMVWEENRTRSMPEIYVVAARSMASNLALLSSLTDQELQLPGLGHGDGTLGGYLTYDGDHMRLHLTWAMEGMANGTVPQHHHAGTT
jgi:hypothetical protein